MLLGLTSSPSMVATFAGDCDILQRRQWHPTPVLLHGESHRGRSLEGCSPWGLTWLRVRHGCATSLSPLTFMHWRRKRQPTPVFLPGESPGRGSLVGCRLWGRTESDMTEVTSFSLSCIGEGNGNPLQCSCLENPRDDGLPSMGAHRVGHD